jgi:hypothetical protein
MDEYRHQVSGLFVHQEDAESALSTLVKRGVPRNRLQLFKSLSTTPTTGPQARSNDVLKDVLVDSAIGTAAGAGIGALAELALVAGSITLFAASPLIAPLVMLGWGASLGGLIGAATGASVGAGKTEKKFADLISDAISLGQIVLVAETRTEQETTIAREVIQASIGDYTDLGTSSHRTESGATL